MIRQKAPRDASLALGVSPAAVLTSPVVTPRRRAPEDEGSAPAWVPTVRKRAPTIVEIDLPTVAPVSADVATLFTHATEFLTGAAGCGKTFKVKARAEQDKSVLLCATTGIAAINLGGETIDSILRYFDTASLQEAYFNGFLTTQLRRLWKVGVKRISVDEVSMLPADQLSFLVRGVNELNGQGYSLSTKDADDEEQGPPAMSVTLVGDFAQLSPVKAPYAFEAYEWDRFEAHTITLTEIRRQADPDFIGMLRAARLGRGQEVADYFVSRTAICPETDDHFEGSTILARNEPVERYNTHRMAQLTGATIAFPSTRTGKQRSEWGNPDKPPHTWGIPPVLTLKIGALVMILSNYRDEDKQLVYVNGDLGTLVEAEHGSAIVQLQRTGEVVAVVPVTRTVRLPIDSARRTELRKAGKADRIDGKWEIAGEITYMPLRVAYASTVHKSQGLSLDRVQVNVRDHFFKTPGMLYVALSRARTAEGLRLVGSPKAIIERCVTDPRLARWL